MSIREYIGKMITVKYYSGLIRHSADDSPSFPQVHEIEITGVLNDVTSDGIVIDGKSIPFFEEVDPMKNGVGVPVGCGYITTRKGISLILCGGETIYKSKGGEP